MGLQFVLVGAVGMVVFAAWLYAKGFQDSEMQNRLKAIEVLAEAKETAVELRVAAQGRVAKAQAAIVESDARYDRDAVESQLAAEARVKAERRVWQRRVDEVEAHSGDAAALQEQLDSALQLLSPGAQCRPGCTIP